MLIVVGCIINIINVCAVFSTTQKHKKDENIKKQEENKKNIESKRMALI